MSSANKVSVKIYGQDYTIAGDKSREQIIQVADRVDKTMNDIAEVVNGIPVASLAVLTAVNIADELFVMSIDHSEMEQEKEQLQKDIDHYMQLWEEAKKSFLQYKEDSQGIVDQKDQLQAKVTEKDAEVKKLTKTISEKDALIKELEDKLESANSKMKSKSEGQNVTLEQIKDLEEKYKEIEGNYFELQMENIQLKGDLDKYKKDEDDF